MTNRRVLNFEADTDSAEVDYARSPLADEGNDGHGEGLSYIAGTTHFLSTHDFESMYLGQQRASTQRSSTKQGRRGQTPRKDGVAYGLSPRRSPRYGRELSKTPLYTPSRPAAARPLQSAVAFSDPRSRAQKRFARAYGAVAKGSPARYSKPSQGTDQRERLATLQRMILDPNGEVRRGEGSATAHGAMGEDMDDPLLGVTARLRAEVEAVRKDRRTPARSASSRRVADLEYHSEYQWLSMVRELNDSRRRAQALESALQRAQVTIRALYNAPTEDNDGEDGAGATSENGGSTERDRLAKRVCYLEEKLTESEVALAAVRDDKRAACTKRLRDELSAAEGVIKRLRHRTSDVRTPGEAVHATPRAQSDANASTLASAHDNSPDEKQRSTEKVTPARSSPPVTPRAETRPTEMQENITILQLRERIRHLVEQCGEYQAEMLSARAVATQLSADRKALSKELEALRCVPQELLAAVEERDAARAACLESDRRLQQYTQVYDRFPSPAAVENMIEERNHLLDLMQLKNDQEAVLRSEVEEAQRTAAKIAEERFGQTLAQERALAGDRERDFVETIAKLRKELAETRRAAERQRRELETHIAEMKVDQEEDLVSNLLNGSRAPVSPAKRSPGEQTSSAALLPHPSASAGQSISMLSRSTGASTPAKDHASARSSPAQTPAEIPALKETYASEPESRASSSPVFNGDLPALPQLPSLESSRRETSSSPSSSTVMSESVESSVAESKPSVESVQDVDVNEDESVPQDSERDSTPPPEPLLEYDESKPVTVEVQEEEHIGDSTPSSSGSAENAEDMPVAVPLRAAASADKSATASVGASPTVPPAPTTPSRALPFATTAASATPPPGKQLSLQFPTPPAAMPPPVSILVNRANTVGPQFGHLHVSVHSPQPSSSAGDALSMEDHTHSVTTTSDMDSASSDSYSTSEPSSRDSPVSQTIAQPSTTAVAGANTNPLDSQSEAGAGESAPAGTGIEVRSPVLETTNELADVAESAAKPPSSPTQPLSASPKEANDAGGLGESASPSTALVESVTTPTLPPTISGRVIPSPPSAVPFKTPAASVSTPKALVAVLANEEDADAHGGIHSNEGSSNSGWCSGDASFDFIGGLAEKRKEEELYGRTLYGNVLSSSATHYMTGLTTPMTNPAPPQVCPTATPTGATEPVPQHSPAFPVDEAANDAVHLNSPLHDAGQSDSAPHLPADSGSGPAPSATPPVESARDSPDVSADDHNKTDVATTLLSEEPLPPVPDTPADTLELSSHTPPLSPVESADAAAAAAATAEGAADATTDATTDAAAAADNAADPGTTADAAAQESGSRPSTPPPASDPVELPNPSSVPDLPSDGPAEREAAQDTADATAPSLEKTEPSPLKELRTPSGGALEVEETPEPLRDEDSDAATPIVSEAPENHANSESPPAAEQAATDGGDEPNSSLSSFGGVNEMSSIPAASHDTTRRTASEEALAEHLQEENAPASVAADEHPSASPEDGAVSQPVAEEASGELPLQDENSHHSNPPDRYEATGTNTADTSDGAVGGEESLEAQHSGNL